MNTLASTDVEERKHGEEDLRMKLRMSSNNMTVHWNNDQTLGELMKDLLTRALDAHGGLSRWREIEAFQLKVSIGGGLWRLKGLPDGLRDSPRIIEETRQYIHDFDRVAKTSTTARELYDKMLELYPDRVNSGALWLSARAVKP